MPRRLAILPAICVTFAAAVVVGCSKPPSANTPEYRKKTEPVVAALAKLKSDVDASAGAPAFAADYAAAEKVVQAWEGSLSAEEKDLDSAKSIEFAKMSYAMVGTSLRGPQQAKAAQGPAAAAGQATDKARELLGQGK